MKQLCLLFLILSVMLSACNSGTETKTDQTSDETSAPESVLKTTRQFVTNEDGSVTENEIGAEITFYKEKITFVFSSKPEQNFEITVTTKEESPSGIKYIVKDKKYTDVFVSSGAEPQVNLNAPYGSTTFM